MPPLRLAAKFRMPASVTGRFDHLAADPASNRLFLAAESAHEVLVFNLRTGRYERAIPGIGIPHAVLVRPRLGRIFVTDGGAGAVRIYNARTYALLATVPLKKDADSIAFDRATGVLYVDNGGGDAGESFSIFSAIDTATGRMAWQIKIDGDTLEAMALARQSPLIYINNRAKNQITIVDRTTHRIVANWPVTLSRENVAMALDEAHHRLFIGCRGGAIVVFDTQTGKQLRALPIPTGIDDLIFDAARQRLYASCGSGSGAIAVYQEESPDQYRSLTTVASAPGGKNEVLVPQLDRLYVTIPPHGGAAGAVYVYEVN
ncbi:MAG TPA: PQQ-binding-like beta-propeller repeat protein [Terriglobales bacterium]|nr:PQQ-binding-like beta-propeller repeat protein [Terriglobales bacterium]